MEKQKETNYNTYPELNIEILNVEAKKLATAYPEIFEIKLYHCNNNPSKYVYAIISTVAEKVEDNEEKDTEGSVDQEWRFIKSIDMIGETKESLFSRRFYKVYKNEHLFNEIDQFKYRDDWYVNFFEIDEPLPSFILKASELILFDINGGNQNQNQKQKEIDGILRQAIEPLEYIWKSMTKNKGASSWLQEYDYKNLHKLAIQALREFNRNSVLKKSDIDFPDFYSLSSKYERQYRGRVLRQMILTRLKIDISEQKLHKRYQELKKETK